MKRNIDWLYIPAVRITFPELNELLQNLKERGITEIFPNEGCRTITSIHKCYNHFFWAYEKLHLVDENGIIKYKIIKEGDSKEDEPYDYFMQVKEQFYKIHKQSFNSVFCSVPKTFFELRRCVPSQLSWYCKNKEIRYQHLSNCFKADVSSAFSSECCKTLPTWRNHLIKPGIVQPNIAYPFAFVSTGRLIIYKELDTEDFFGTPFYYDRAQIHKRNREVEVTFGYPKVELEKELGYKSEEKVYTILMKKAPLTLRETMNYFYNQKQEGNETAKKVMNYFIGMCWQKMNPIHLHLAAVVIARCNKRMIDTAYELVRRNNLPVLIATDSIAWVGKCEEDLVARTKFLGSFTLECEDGEMIIGSSKCYQIKSGNKVATLWSGVPKEVSRQLPFGNINASNAADYDYAYIEGKVMRIILKDDTIIGMEEL